MPWLQHRLCLASRVVVACEGLVLRPVNGGDRAKAVAALVVGSSMPHGRRDLAHHDAVCLSSAEKSLLLLLWRPSVPRWLGGRCAGHPCCLPRWLVSSGCLGARA